MDWTSIIVAAISGIALIYAAGVGHRVKKDQERSERRSIRRAEESALSMKMQSASIKLSVVTAKKVNGGEVNGDLKEAMHAAEIAGGEYENFVLRMAAEQTTKI